MYYKTTAREINAKGIAMKPNTTTIEVNRWQLAQIVLGLDLAKKRIVRNHKARAKRRGEKPGEIASTACAAGDLEGLREQLIKKFDEAFLQPEKKAKATREGTGE